MSASIHAGAKQLEAVPASLLVLPTPYPLASAWALLPGNGELTRAGQLLPSPVRKPGGSRGRRQGEAAAVWLQLLAIQSQLGFPPAGSCEAASALQLGRGEQEGTAIEMQLPAAWPQHKCRQCHITHTLMMCYQSHQEVAGSCIKRFTWWKAAGVQLFH